MLHTHALTVIVPSVVNLQALLSRFMHTYYTRCLSTLTDNLGTSCFSLIFLDAAYISITRATSVRVGYISQRTYLGVKVPLYIWALSKLSFTLLSIITAENYIISRCFRFIGLNSEARSSSVKLIHVESGVRISCETLALYIVVRRSFVSFSLRICKAVVSYRKINTLSSPP